MVRWMHIHTRPTPCPLFRVCTFLYPYLVSCREQTVRRCLGLSPRTDVAAVPVTEPCQCSPVWGYQLVTLGHFSLAWFSFNTYVHMGLNQNRFGQTGRWVKALHSWRLSPRAQPSYRCSTCVAAACSPQPHICTLNRVRNG